MINSPFKEGNNQFSTSTNSLRIVSALILIFMIVGSSACAGKESATRVNIGHSDDYPPDSVTQIDLAAAFNDPGLSESGAEIPGFVTEMQGKLITPIPIFLVNDSSEGLIAIYARGPHLGCAVRWLETEQRFLNPCHGEQYSRTGDWLEGPAPRGLDRFAVSVSEAGEIWVDVQRVSIWGC